MSVIYSDSAGAKVNALIKQKSTTAALWGAIRAGDFSKIEQAIKSIQYQSDLLLELLLAVVSTGDRIQVTDGTGKPVALIGQLDGNVFGIHATEAYFGGTLGDVSTAQVSVVNGSATFSGTVSASAFNVYVPLLTSLTLTNNSPSAGKIAWDATSLYFAGTAYSIASGNTSSATHKHVYWVRGASTFTTAVEMPINVDNYLIATNTAGVADIALGKTGTSKSITEDALVPTLLKGIAIQTPALGQKNLAFVSTLTVLNVTSGGGALLSIYIIVNQSVAGAGGLTAYLDITVDGETLQSIQLYNTSAVALEGWDAVSDVRLGDMSALGDYRQMTSLSVSFSESLLVQARVGNASSAGGLNIYVNYGLKTAA